MDNKMRPHDLVVESLTEALLQLMETKPFIDIKVTELCKRAGVSRISFYRNFNSFQEILTKHLNRCTDEWWAVYSQKPADELYKRFWPELLDQYRRNRKLITLIYNSNLQYVLKDHIFSCCGPKPEHDELTAYTCAVLAGAIYGFVDEWIKTGMTDAPVELNLREMVQIIKRSQQKSEPITR